MSEPASSPFTPGAGREEGSPARHDSDPAGPPAGGASLDLDRPTALRLLGEGELEIRGRLVDASNATLYCAVRLRCPPPEPPIVGACIYKPARGERPLHDFPDGTLAKREVAAYLVSAASGLDIVPPTVLRDGPFGPGMVQLWIDVDGRVDVVEMIRRADVRLRRIALFDAVVNNADRKGGHLLPTASGHVYGVDHGICFAAEPKLRTILWQWRGKALEPAEAALLARLLQEVRGGLGRRLRALLSPGEVRATEHRIDRLIADGRFPHPDPERPAIPWPPF